MKSILLILILIPLTLQAQQDEWGWHGGISICPEFSAMTIQNEEEYSPPSYGFYGGLTIGFNITKAITWESGIYYGYKNVNYTQGGLIFEADIDPVDGIKGSSEHNQIVSINEFEIPLQIKYFIFKSLYFRSGIGINYLSERRYENIINHSDETTTTFTSSPLSYLNFTGTLGMGYMQPIGDRFNLNIEPYIKYYFIDNTIPTTHLYNIGIKAACTMRLSK